MAGKGSGGTLKVASARSLQEVLKPLGAAFEASAGTLVEFFFGPVGTVRERLDAGEPADVIILSDALILELAEAGRVVAASRRDLGRVGIMVAVREGSQAPDVSTPERFKQALVAAKAIACSDPAIGGSAGTHFAALLKQFGIEHAVGHKLLKRSTGVKVAETVAAGEADIGITLLPEMLPVKGVRAAAPLPGALQKYTTYVAAVATSCAMPDVAAAFIRAAVDPGVGGHWRTAGVDPL
jgi:molybdate transport system substrate-binding protein